MNEAKFVLRELTAGIFSPSEYAKDALSLVDKLFKRHTVHAEQPAVNVVVRDTKALEGAGWANWIEREFIAIAAHPGVVDEHGRIMIVAPWSHARAKQWDPPMSETFARTMRMLMVERSRQVGSPLLFTRNAWHVNLAQYKSLRPALEWIEQHPITPAEWRRHYNKHIIRERRRANKRRQARRDKTA